MVVAGHKASETKGFEAEQQAAYKAIDTRKGWPPGTTARMHAKPEFVCSVCFQTRRIEQLSDEHPEPTCRDHD